MNSSIKQNSGKSLDNNEKKQLDKKEKNIYVNKKINKYSSFNNIQISSNNNDNNFKKDITYSYIPNNKKENKNLQISNINNDDSKYTNNNSHQRIIFIANNVKENPQSQNKYINSKITSSQGISYIMSNDYEQKNKNNNSSNDYSESSHNEFTYIANENSKNKELKISSNFKNNQLNITCQGVSYIAQEQPKPQEKNNNLEITSSSNKDSNNYISYIAPKKSINNNYSIEYNPMNFKDNQNGISFIAKNNNYQLSNQNNSYSYIAPGKTKSNTLGKNFNANNFEISSNKNNYFYIAKDKHEKNEDNKEKLNCFKFNHNESMNFICEDKKIKNNNNFAFTKCEGDNFKYIKDDATGAQILEQN